MRRPVRFLAVTVSLALALAVSQVACSKDEPTQPPGPTRRTLSFALQPAIPLTSVPRATIATGDFDKDGNVDLATASSESALVHVCLGRGDGSFQTPLRIAVLAHDVVAGDWDHDGNLDLAVGYFPSIAFLYGRGDGTFDSPIPVAPVPGQGTPAAGDFNGDGVDDCVGQHGDSVGVVLGNAARTHLRVASYAPKGPFSSGGKGVADDFDGNGHLDYAVPGIGTTNRFHVYYGNGDGSVQYPIAPIDAGWDAGACSIRRPGGPPGRDIAVAHTVVVGTVGVLRRVSGTFVGEITYPAGASPTDVGAGDFDADGIEDLVVASAGNNSIAVLLGRSDGTFEPATHFNAGNLPQRLAVADVNNDGTPDAAVVGLHAIYVLLNTSK